MSRRLVSLVLIALLLGSPMLRAEQSSEFRAQVRVRDASAEQLRALCAAAAKDGASVRLVEQGAQAIIEISAADPADLYKAVAAVKRATGAAGLQAADASAGSTAPSEALLSRTTDVFPAAKPLCPLQAAFSPDPAAAAKSPPAALRTDDSPPPADAPADSTHLTRGPPA